MARYKVLLVDDEEDVRHAIALKLDWETIGFEVVGEAANGVEALEMVETLTPDVIMTDIKMPFMDGLTLCKHARKILPDVRLAVFSGFDEFDYAREAIKLDVTEYIMKPIDADELAEVFRGIAGSLDKEINERRNHEKLQKYYEESLPLFRQQLLSSLISGHQVSKRLEEYGIEFNAAKYGVAVVNYKPDIMSGDWSHEYVRLTSFSLQQIISENLEQEIPYYIIPSPEHLVLVLLLPEDLDMKDVLWRLSRLVAPVKRLLGLRLFIGIGNSYRDISGISISHEEAMEALEYQKVMDVGPCIYIGDINAISGLAGSNLRSSAYVAEILRQIKVGDRHSLEQAVSALIQNFAAYPQSHLQYKYFLFEIGNGFQQLIQNYDLNFADRGLLLEGMLQERSQTPYVQIEELKGWLSGVTDELRRQIRHKQKDRTRLLVDKAKLFMQEHYKDCNLSLDSLCDVLNVSPSYFSTIFKKDTGKSFIGFLTSLRIERALELLGSTDDKTYIIAEKIGYTDPNYFSYVFKKQMGISPTKYRMTVLHDYE